jgi:cytoskeletal protein CcmA (bactofilin family)
MASERTVLGQGTRVRGRILGGHDLEIHGHVEGEIEAGGEVIVGATGTVGANLSSTRIVIRGAVRGDLIATESIHLEDGARVVGDVRAPRIAIAQGALVRGYVQTGVASAAPRRASTPTPARVATPVARPAAPPPAAKKAPPPPPPKSAPAKKAPVVTLAGAKVAPKPVVPVLKKGAKGTLAKKRG